MVYVRTAREVRAGVCRARELGVGEGGEMDGKMTLTLRISDKQVGLLEAPGVVKIGEKTTTS